MSNLTIIFQLILKDISTEFQSDKHTNAKFLMKIDFMGRTTGVASLKLSELMPLVGGRQSSDFRKLQEVAISSVNGEDANPAPVIVSVPINTFKEWAKNFGNSQALQIINAL